MLVVVTVGTVGNTIDNYRSNFSTPIGRVVSLLKGIHPLPLPIGTEAADLAAFGVQVSIMGSHLPTINVTRPARGNRQADIRVPTSSRAIRQHGETPPPSRRRAACEWIKQIKLSHK